VKVIFGKVYSATIFSDEGMLMSEFAAGFVHLRTRTSRHPHNRYRRVIQSGAKLLESCASLAAHGHNRINRTEHNRRRLPQSKSSEILQVILACIV